MESVITHICAREILDSRGIPTIETEIALDHCGVVVRASVPSGASTGQFEALEKRDNDPKRYFGKGVLCVKEAINSIIAPALIDMCVLDQQGIDNRLLELDGTENKSNLGANALLSVSLCVAKAAAACVGLPLYRYLGGVMSYKLPVPFINVINGGAHASNNLDIQEMMIVPKGAESFSKAMQMGSEVFNSLKKLLKEKNFSIAVGDEGGVAPSFESHTQALDMLVKAIEMASYVPGKDIAIAIDVAASEFYQKGYYQFEGKHHTYKDMIDFYKKLIHHYPIISIEDGLAEEDWQGWHELTKEIGHKCQLVGDDIFVTNPKRLSKGIDEKVGNAILIKLNQIGTLSETLKTIHMAKDRGYKIMISHRSGETEDTFLADLAVAVNAGQIKTGSMCRSERIAKYNQLLRIEDDLQGAAVYGF